MPVLVAAAVLLGASTPTRADLPVGYGALGYSPPEPGSYSLPVLFPAPDGSVLAEDGDEARLHDVLGDHVVLLSFVYSTCDDAAGCPLAMAVLHRVRQQLRSHPEFASSLRLVTLSFDPRHDTPEVMRLYSRGLSGSSPDWRFLTTASPEALAPILAGYGQSIDVDYDEQGTPLGSFTHLLRVFLIDRDRRVRNVYSVSYLHPDLLVADVRTLLLEERNPTPESTPPSHSRSPRAGLAAAGDYRQGYEDADYATRSRSVRGRAGAPADLPELVRAPPLGLPPVPVPVDNPITTAKVALGRKLFHDRRLSLNNTMSCAMCHVPEQGFAHNELAKAVGIEGRSVRRNAPTILNSAYLARLFHDGREYTLEQQAWGPLLARNEMGNPSVGRVIRRLQELEDYRGLFETAFAGHAPSMHTVGEALASYERTLVSGGSAFDRWYYGKDEDAMSPSARRGFTLFSGRAGCATCHTIGPDHALFTDGELHNTGVGYRESMGREPASRQVTIAPGVTVEVASSIIASVSEETAPDLGLYEVTQDPNDRWKYRTPTLRNVALTAPYMHNGSLPTLEAVVGFYDRGGVPNEVLDPLIRPLGLTQQESRDLVAFLESLTGTGIDALVADALAAPVGDPVGDPR
jgi:cytochrome c peroxidase